MCSAAACLTACSTDKAVQWRGLPDLRYSGIVQCRECRVISTEGPFHTEEGFISSASMAVCQQASCKVIIRGLLLALHNIALYFIGGCFI